MPIDIGPGPGLEPTPRMYAVDVNTAAIVSVIHALRQDVAAQTEILKQILEEVSHGTQAGPAR